LSIPGHSAISQAHIDRLEDAVEHYNAELPPLKEFILPGGTRVAALTHVGRTVCRRAERSVVALAAEDPTVSMPSRVYLNRLSDLLFVLARALNRAGGAPDVLWQKDRARGNPAA
jgi:cob(I)alamin adenosyltransferase